MKCLNFSREAAQLSVFPCTAIVAVLSIPPEEISCVDFVFDVVQDLVVAVCDDGIAAFLEFFDVVDDCASLIVNGSRG